MLDDSTGLCSTDTKVVLLTLIWFYWPWYGSTDTRVVLLMLGWFYWHQGGSTDTRVVLLMLGWFYWHQGGSTDTRVVLLMWGWFSCGSTVVRLVLLLWAWFYWYVAGSTDMFLVLLWFYCCEAGSTAQCQEAVLREEDSSLCCRVSRERLLPLYYFLCLTCWAQAPFWGCVILSLYTVCIHLGSDLILKPGSLDVSVALDFTSVLVSPDCEFSTQKTFEWMMCCRCSEVCVYLRSIYVFHHSLQPYSVSECWNGRVLFCLTCGQM